MYTLIVTLAGCQPLAPRILRLFLDERFSDLFFSRVPPGAVSFLSGCWSSEMFRWLHVSELPTGEITMLWEPEL